MALRMGIEQEGGSGVRDGSGVREGEWEPGVSGGSSVMGREWSEWQEWSEGAGVELVAGLE